MNEKIKQWALQRKLNTSTLEAQWEKLYEEYCEIAQATTDDMLMDAIGDVQVVWRVMCLISNVDMPSIDERHYNNVSNVDSFEECHLQLSHNILWSKPSWNDSLIDNITYGLSYLAAMAESKGWTLEQCLDHSYEEIKDRVGIMIDGKYEKGVLINNDTQIQLTKTGDIHPWLLTQ